MSLANLLTKGSLRRVANANHANVAKHAPDTLPTLARLATLALANTPNPAANDPAPTPTVAAVNAQAAVSSDAVSTLVSTEMATDEAPALETDRWCWPHSTAMNGREIDTFTARLARLNVKGLSLDAAESVADKLVTRDRESDDRRLCLECTHLAGYATNAWQCRNWQRAGVALKARDAGLPADLVRLLQRCDGFKEIHHG